MAILQFKTRYLQLAFNGDLAMARALVPTLPRNNRILVEAGTPFIKREGLAGIRAICDMCTEQIVVADIKTTDGGASEVEMVYHAGARAATVMGSAPLETINRFIAKCKTLDMISMIDMLGVDDPLPVIRNLKRPPDVMVLHRGRDEETTRGKVIEYRHVNRVRSKYDVLISAAGGVDLREARSAIFNGANIVVVNIIKPSADLTGIRSNTDVAGIAQKFLDTIA